MATLQLPLRSDIESYTFSAGLDGRTYNFKVYWNARALRWFISIGDTESSEYAISGVALVCETNLVGRFKLPRLPPGALTILDTTGAHAEPDRTGLGSRWLLLYEEAGG